jgi:Fic family protein
MDLFYSESPLWPERVAKISALLERVKVSVDEFGDTERLKSLYLILNVHATTAIEGNRLTSEKVWSLLKGSRITTYYNREIQEVLNACKAYEELDGFDPWNLDSLFRAHTLMTFEVVKESGVFRTVDVAVVDADGTVLHQGADPASVPGMVEKLLSLGKQDLAHPLIKSSAVHFMLEHIRPFFGGNGRIGRLWQKLILSKWDPRLALIPLEKMIHSNQALYCETLQKSHTGKVDCRPFIDYMLDMIENAMNDFIEVVKKIKESSPPPNKT